MRDPLKKGQDRVDITVPRADALQLGALKVRSFVSHWKKIKCLGKGIEPRSRGPPPSPRAAGTRGYRAPRWYPHAALEASERLPTGDPLRASARCSGGRAGGSGALRGSTGDRRPLLLTYICPTVK